MHRYGCDDRQKQCNRNYMAMDDIYMTVRMRLKLCDDRQYLCDDTDVAIDSKLKDAMTV